VRKRQMQLRCKTAARCTCKTSATAATPRRDKGRAQCRAAHCAQLLPFTAFEMQLRKPRSVMPRYTERDIDAARLKDLYAFVQSMPTGSAASTIPLLRDAMRNP
jgi:hypothetical protein